jgi:N-dimethylarginine dimethylaminohydrolase
MRTLILCPPDFYGIEYEINPWMSRAHGSDSTLARAQWKGLRQCLEAIGCAIELVTPQRGLPDMVFTANAGLISGRRFISSNFRYQERRGEEQHFKAWFAGKGYEVATLPEDLKFEGEGDALFCGDTIFCGYRFRSDIRAHRKIGEMLERLVISVELVQDRFYHLDTCFCPLRDGLAMWYPGAFEEYGRRAIQEHVGELVEASEEEAMRFGCNAVVVDQHVVLPSGCPKLTGELAKRGFTTHELPMTEFLKAGGACKCLTLYLLN